MTGELDGSSFTYKSEDANTSALITEFNTVGTVSQTTNTNVVGLTQLALDIANIINNNVVLNTAGIVARYNL